VAEVSRFLGIVIVIFYRDREPSHFHAISGDFDITVGIEDGVVEGRFPRRALEHVVEWLDAHRPELQDNWALSRSGGLLRAIAPLE
jgi:hypothetical protein